MDNNDESLVVRYDDEEPEHYDYGVIEYSPKRPPAVLFMFLAITIIGYFVVHAIIVLSMESMNTCQGYSKLFFPITIGQYIMILCTFYVYNNSKLVFYFEPDGIRIVGCKGNHHYFKYEHFSYVYRASTPKGFHFFILSPRKLEYKEIRRLSHKLPPVYLPKGVDISEAIVTFSVSSESFIPIRKRVTRRLFKTMEYIDITTRMSL